MACSTPARMRMTAAVTVMPTAVPLGAGAVRLLFCRVAIEGLRSRHVPRSAGHVAQSTSSVPDAFHDPPITTSRTSPCGCDTRSCPCCVLAGGSPSPARPVRAVRYPPLLCHPGCVTRHGWTDESDASPAERFAGSADRRSHPLLAEFTLTRPFTLDQFQVDACRALERGRGVLVCAPTGAGKTVVGEFAVHQALATGGKCFYTTPIKALSNQKFADLIAAYGPDRVGLLTGDTSINSHAPVVVMTTEVLRNMLYAGSADLRGLTHVVMDEIHYLADKFRGAVWEEVILHLAADVQLVGLSATVSNAEEFGAWLAEVRGELTVVVDEIRPVPLWQHMLVGR